MELQAKKLKAMVNHAYQKVPFYHRLYVEAGVDLNSITGTSSLSKLPIVTKQLLRDTPLKERTSVDTDCGSSVARTTSGSTGMPITTLQNPATVSYRIALWLRKLWAYGVRPQHKAYISIPGRESSSLFSSVRGFSNFVGKRKLRSLSLAADLHDNFRRISTWKPDVLVAPPSYFRALIRFSEEATQLQPLKVAVTMGEALDNSTRKLIEETFQTEAFVSYGLGEVGGVAWECPTHSGYHINIDSLVVEFLRDREGLTDAHSGELCVTNLYNEATPVIRYRTGDIATLLDDDCACGRRLPLMKNIEGRILDFIQTSDGRYISPYTLMHTLEGVSGIAQYKVTQRKDYSVVVLVQVADAEVEPVLQLIQHRCRQLLGDTPLFIKRVDGTENLAVSKFRVVESQLNR